MRTGGLARDAARATQRRRVRLDTLGAGEGLPAAEAEKVFEKFYQLRKTDWIRAGTRLGLAIVRGFVEAITHAPLVKALSASSDPQYLRVSMRQLRQKLEADPEHPRVLFTKTGVGYRLRAPNGEASVTSRNVDDRFFARPKDGA